LSIIVDVQKKQEKFADKGDSRYGLSSDHGFSTALYIYKNHIPLYSLYNLDGTKVKKLTDVKTFVEYSKQGNGVIKQKNVVLVVREDENALMDEVVRRVKELHEVKPHEYEEHKNENYRHIMRGVIDKWYDQNLQNWKNRSQLMLSGDNVKTYMEMYKRKQEKRDISNRSVD
jgi:hypothetical protein